MIHPVNIPDVFTTPPDEGGTNPFGRKSSINRASCPMDYATDGRRLLTGTEAGNSEHVSSLWTRTLRGSFINRLRDGSLQNDPSATNSLSRAPSEEDSFQYQVSDPASPITVTESPFEFKEHKPLEVRVDLLIADNVKEHHTDRFDMVKRDEQPQLVVRRGQTFKINLILNREFIPQSDNIAIMFQFGKFGTESRGTRVYLPCNGGYTNSGWSIDNVRIKDRHATVTVKSPPICVVGVWLLEVRTTHIHENTKRSTLCPVGVVYVLFNPWCAQDTVFMEVDDDRNEYVLNDVGRIWKGGHNVPIATDWIYGQFEDSVIETSMLLLDKATRSSLLRSSPVQVSRAISQLTNANDEGGVIVGKWSKPFEGGVHPSAWTGSAAILREYAATGMSVKYGQCSTFSGVLCTVLRCLGIPCRVVTNYKSAHDTDTSCTVDFHYSLTTNSPMDEYNDDTVWNFHCWNDCWMERPDLPRGYGGWQALDATPMERSQGLFRMGPASLRAVKEGEIGFAHDTAFVFAEVNADHCEWLVDEKKKSMRLISIETQKIGKMIFTKRPGKQVRGSNEEILDVTSEYKHPEMTPEERSAVLNALSIGHSTVLNQYTNNQKEKITDVKFRLEMKEKVSVGDDFTVKVHVTNSNNKETRTAKISVLIRSSSYTGNAQQLIRSDYKMITLQPGQKSEIGLGVQVEEYLDKISEDASFLVSVMAHVPQTGQIFAETDDFELIQSSIQINISESMNVSETYEAVLKVRNPIPRMLTGCQFTAESPGLSLPRKFKCQNIPPRTVASIKFTVKPWRTGEKVLLAQFTSDQIINVQGVATINVQQK